MPGQNSVFVMRMSSRFRHLEQRVYVWLKFSSNQVKIWSGCHRLIVSLIQAVAELPLWESEEVLRLVNGEKKGQVF